MLALTACGGGGDEQPPPNVAPVATAGPAQTVDAGTRLQLAGSGTDANQDVITYLWTLSGPAGSIATLENYHVATPTFTPDIAGGYVATLKVNDGKLDSASSSVTITAQVPVAAFAALPEGNSCLTGQRIYTIDGHLVFISKSGTDCIGNGTGHEKLFESTPAAPLCVNDGMVVPLNYCTNNSDETLMRTMMANLGQADLGLGASHQVKLVYPTGP
ncbi:PKD domain-containing protein [Rugamonas sp.]|uniref:PKD domain-containing protein n=1 Tax=Rugamonas sp. TaxID=1926287 RepID=UPI0025ED1042|nr:PKD domain-containing protein [Rugamonas sp.]